MADDIRVTLGGDSSGLNRALGQAQTAIGRLRGQAQAELNQISRTFRAELGGATQSVGALNRGLAGAAQSSAPLRQSLAGLGGPFRLLSGGAIAGTAAVAGLVAVFSASVERASAFNKAMAEVSTLLPGATGEIQKMRGAVQDLAVAHGSSNVAQAKALYQIISAGATSASEAIATLDAANRLAIGGVTSVEQAADGLTTVINAYAGAAGSATDISDAMFTAMRLGKTTIGELSASLGRIVPIAATAGVGFDELLSSVVALTKQGISTKESMAGLRAIIAAVLKPTTEAQEEAARLGLEFNSAALASKGLAGFLDELREKTAGSAASLAKLFGGVEALVPAMALLGAGARDVAASQEEMAKKAGATGRAYAEMEKEADMASKRAAAATELWATAIGNTLLPMVTALKNAWADAILPATQTLPALEAMAAALRKEIDGLDNRESEGLLKRRLAGVEELIRRQRELAAVEEIQAAGSRLAAAGRKREDDRRKQAAEAGIKQAADEAFAIEVARVLEASYVAAQKEAAAVLKSVHEDFMRATGREIDAIKEKRDADIKALDEAVLTAAERASARAEIEEAASARIAAAVQAEADKRKRLADAALAEAKKTKDVLDRIAEGALKAADDQIGLIERRRAADLAALEASAATEAEKAAARVQVNQRASAEIVEARRKEAEETAKVQAALDSIQEAWLQATDQQLALIEKRRAADLESLDKLVASEAEKAEARVQINAKAAADIAELRRKEGAPERALDKYIADLETAAELEALSTEEKAKAEAILRAQLALLDEQGQAVRQLTEAERGRIVAAVERRREAEGERETYRELGESIGGSLDRVQQGITNAWLAGEKGALNFKNVALAAIADVIQALARLGASKIFGEAGGGSGGGGGLGSIIAGAIGALVSGAGGAGSSGFAASQAASGGTVFFHGGGVVGAGGRPGPRISAAAIAAAPRLHDGMIRSNEFASVLERGEMVLNQRQQAALLAGAVGEAPVINVNNFAGVQVSARRRGREVDIDLRLVEGMVVDQVMNGGPIRQALESGGFDPARGRR